MASADAAAQGIGLFRPPEGHDQRAHPHQPQPEEIVQRIGSAGCGFIRILGHRSGQPIAAASVASADASVPDSGAGTSGRRGQASAQASHTSASKDVARRIASSVLAGCIRRIRRIHRFQLAASRSHQSADCSSSHHTSHFVHRLQRAVEEAAPVAGRRIKLG